MRPASTNGWPCSRADAWYWVPSQPDQANPRDTISLIYDDRRLLETRVRRLASPRIYSQEPPSRTSRMIGNVTIEEAAPDGQACTVRSKCQVLEYRRETQRLFGGTCSSSPGPRRERHSNCLEARGPGQLRRPARRTARAVLMSCVRLAETGGLEGELHHVDRNRSPQDHRRRSQCGALLGLGLVDNARRLAAESVTYLFPAPPSLPAFGPIQLAKGKGYFAQAGLDVSYAVGRGGVDVAKQVGAGNAPLGGIVADGPIMVRQNGVPIKIVAVFGGKGFMQLVVREDSGIQKPSDLKGKTISVMSFQDTTFYALLGLLASAGLTQDDVNIQAAGPSRRLGIRRHRQGRRHGRRAGLDPAGAGRRRQGEGDPDRRVLSRTWRRASASPIRCSRTSPTWCASSSPRRCAA